MRGREPARVCGVTAGDGGGASGYCRGHTVRLESGICGVSLGMLT